MQVQILEKVYDPPPFPHTHTYTQIKKNKTPFKYTRFPRFTYLVDNMSTVTNKTNCTKVNSKNIE